MICYTHIANQKTRSYYVGLNYRFHAFTVMHRYNKPTYENTTPEQESLHLLLVEFFLRNGQGNPISCSGSDVQNTSSTAFLHGVSVELSATWLLRLGMHIATACTSTPQESIVKNT